MSEKTRKKKILFTGLPIVAIICVIAIGVVAYNGTSGYRAGRQIDLGNKYLADLNYEEAILCFQKALEIAPKNQEIIEVISSYMDEFYVQAKAYGEQGNYEQEREIAIFMLTVDENSYQGNLAKGEAAFGMNGFVEAKEAYERAEKNGAPVEELETPLEYSRIMAGLEEREEENFTKFLKTNGADASSKLGEAVSGLTAVVKAGDWNALFSYIDSDKFALIRELLNGTEPLVLESNMTIIIGERDGSLYIVSGQMTDGVLQGTGMMAVSSVNTNSVWEGELVGSEAEGNGKLSIWNKNEAAEMANVYEGTIAGGLFEGEVLCEMVIHEYDTSEFDINDFIEFSDDGSMTITGDFSPGTQGDWEWDMIAEWIMQDTEQDAEEKGYVASDFNYEIPEKSNIKLKTNKGKISFRMEDGDVILAEEVSDDGCLCIAEYWSDDYVVGIPGFGGSDQKLTGFLKDVTPPVITCSLEIGKWYNGELWVLPELTVTDNRDDGEMLKWDTLVNTEESMQFDSNGNNSPVEYGIKQVYEVTDWSGNKGCLTLIFDIYHDCDTMRYKLVSLQ